MATIASIVTPRGKAAVSIIRVSGDLSWSIARKLTNQDFKANHFKLAWISDGESKIDQALVLPFKAPHSFTGEDVIEFHVHGGLWLCDKVLELILDAGAQLAKPGEFSQRAFINQKLDLSQAEAIMDMVSAETALCGDNATKLYQGVLGKEIYAMRLELMNLLAEIVASIDFPDEVGESDTEKFKTIIQKSIAKIDQLLAGAREGHILRHGYKIALVGDPNAGKSSLMNALLENERAIVTDIAGTTRDTIEESYSINGVPIVLVDTAGIRESADTVEKIGIERSKAAAADADMVLFVEDLTNDLALNSKDELQAQLSKRFLIDLKGKESLLLGTKLDLDGSSPEIFDLKVSALNKTNLSELKDLIYQKIITNQSEASVKVNDRQADLLRQAKASLEKSLDSANLGVPDDFLTIDLKTAIHALSNISGAVVTEELLDSIFSSFCIGK